jgi:hypothetical protein
MPTIGPKRKAVTLHLDAAPDETGEQAFNDLRDLLKAEGVEGHVRRANPVTHDQWILIIGVAGSVGSLTNGISKAIEVWQKMRADRNVQSSDDPIQIDLKARLPADTDLRITVGPRPKAKK